MRLIAKLIFLLNILFILTCMENIFGEWNNPYDPLREDSIPPAEVTDLSATSGDSIISLTWTNPTDEDFEFIEIWYGIGNTNTKFSGVIDSKGTIISNLENNHEYSIKVIAADNLDNKTKGVTVFARTLDTISPEDVSSLSLSPSNSQVILSWHNPDNIDFSHVEIWYGIDTPNTLFDGIIEPSGTIISGLINDNEYTIKVLSIDISGNTSTGVTGVITPADIVAPDEVTDLHAIYNDGEITVSWINPTDEDFHNVEIWFGEGSALDNVFVERLWRSVKQEDVYLKDYRDIRDAKRHLTNYFEYYNNRRRHQSLDDEFPEDIYYGKVKLIAA